MIRGIDTQFQFNIPYSCTDLKWVKISFWQPENKGPSQDRPLPIVKVLNQCFIDADKQLSVILDREETLRFSHKRKAYVELRAGTNTNITFGTKDPVMITVYPTNDEDLLDGLVIPSPIHDYIYFDGQDVADVMDESVININAGTIE